MKRSLYGATLTLTIASFSPAAQATGAAEDAKVPHVINGAANPNSSRSKK